jgi:hypothetical protein
MRVSRAGEARESDDARASATEPLDTSSTLTVRSEVPSAPPTAPDVLTHGRGPRRAVRAPRTMATLKWAGEGLRDWADRPGVRLALQGALVLLAIGVMVLVGAVVVPAGGVDVPSNTLPKATGRGGGVTDIPTDGRSDPAAPPITGVTAPPSSGPTATARPADVYRPWATRLGIALDIPQTALAAYAYTEAVMQVTLPSCHLTWTTLAAIGKVESDHGRAGGAHLLDNGQDSQPIIGPALDGQGGRREVRDTDNGTLDGDRIFDRAVGPMQFIPSTWLVYGADADADGVNNPNDVNDAALAAGRLLCAGNRDLSTAAGWWGAIDAYNTLGTYGNAVFAAANDYGQRSNNVR